MTKRHLRNAIPTALIGMALLSIPLPAGADAEGRWKLDGNGGCYFDGNDDGPDQCRPATAEPGRWKLDGVGGCYFDSTDDGPNQCVPTE